jgi:peroxiredoxin
VSIIAAGQTRISSHRKACAGICGAGLRCSKDMCVSPEWAGDGRWLPRFSRPLRSSPLWTSLLDIDRDGIKKGLRSVLLAAFLGVFATSSLAASDLTGQSAPDFVLKSSNGENLRLSEYRGDVVMINFWATWCGPCRQEMPLLDDLYARYGRVGFSLLGVNIDDDARRAMQMIDELGVNFPVLFDDTKQVSKLYQVEAMPVTVLVDRSGTVRHVHHGYKPGYEEKYLTEIRSLLRE